MPYGISCASDEFQRLSDLFFQDLEGVAAVVDDLIVWADTKEEHDRRLSMVLRRCEEIGLVLNKAKCKLNCDSVRYLDHVFSAEGMSIDPSRVKDLQAIPPPKSLKELQEFLGMVNHVAASIPHYSDLTAPLRELLKKDSFFRWESHR